MLAATGTINKIKFSKSKYRFSAKKHLERLLFDAIQAWLKAVLSAVDGTFPVWTGMAKGSLQPIGELVDIDVSATPVAPARFLRKQNFDLGKALGKQISVAVLENQFGPFKATFQWTTGVKHFEINEQFSVNLPLKHDTPWEAIDRKSTRLNSSH